MLRVAVTAVEVESHNLLAVKALEVVALVALTAAVMLHSLAVDSRSIGYYRC